MQKSENHDKEGLKEFLVKGKFKIIQITEGGALISCIEKDKKIKPFISEDLIIRADYFKKNDLKEGDIIEFSFMYKRD